MASTVQTVQLTSTLLTEQTSSITQMQFIVQAASALLFPPLLAAQSDQAALKVSTGGHAYSQPADASFQDVESENRQPREHNRQLLAENNVLKVWNGFFMRRIEELKLKLKRQVCFLDKLCYIYMDVMNCLISIWL